MAELKIDTTQAQSSLRAVNADLEKTQQGLDATAKSSDNLSEAFENTGKAAENMNTGIGAADTMIQAVSTSAGKLGGTVGNAISKALPALQKALKGTTLSFKALGTAIAATGFGLLVQAAAFLVTHFQEAKIWVETFANASKNALPGVSKLVTGIKNAVGSIANWLRELGGKIMGSKLAQRLGIDKLASKFASIKTAANEATEAVKNYNTVTGATTSSRSGGGNTVTRNEADPIGQVSGANAIAQRSADAVRASTTKKTLDDMKVLTDEYKKQSKVLEFLRKLIKQESKDEAEAMENRIKGAQSYANSIASVAGSIAGMVEQNSAAYKALMTVQVIATTAAGAMTAFTATDNITMVQKWASFAAVLAAGAAQLKALYSNKLETQTVTAVAPVLSTPMSGAQQAAVTAQITSTNNYTPVVLQEQKLADYNAQQVQLKKNTVF